MSNSSFLPNGKGFSCGSPTSAAGQALSPDSAALFRRSCSHATGQGCRTACSQRRFQSPSASPWQASLWSVLQGSAWGLDALEPTAPACKPSKHQLMGDILSVEFYDQLQSQAEMFLPYGHKGVEGIRPAVWGGARLHLPASWRVSIWELHSIYLVRCSTQHPGL